MGGRIDGGDGEVYGVGEGCVDRQQLGEASLKVIAERSPGH